MQGTRTVRMTTKVAEHELCWIDDGRLQDDAASHPGCGSISPHKIHTRTSGHSGQRWQDDVAVEGAAPEPEVALTDYWKGGTTARGGSGWLAASRHGPGPDSFPPKSLKLIEQE